MQPGLAAALTMLLLTSAQSHGEPGFAQSYDYCAKAITRVRIAIEESTGAHIDSIESRVAENPESPIAGRQGEIMIILGSHFIPDDKKRASSSFMENGDAQLRYASLIIGSCEDVGRVNYGLNHSGYSNSWSLLNGKVRQDACIQHNGAMTPAPKWGEQVCGI